MLKNSFSCSAAAQAISHKPEKFSFRTEENKSGAKQKNLI